MINVDKVFAIMLGLLSPLAGRVGAGSGTLALMAHIELGNDDAGIRGLLAYRPEIAGPLTQLAEVLLRGDNTLSRGERELIAAYVSRRNDCVYCANSHGATAAAQLPGGAEQVERTLAAGTGTWTGWEPPLPTIPPSTPVRPSSSSSTAT